MKPLLHFAFWLCIIFCIECSARQDTIDNAVINSKVERKIDLSTHLVKMTTTITLENAGRTPIKSFLYALEPSLQNYLSYLSANVKDKDEKLGISKATVSSKKDVSFWRIDLPSSLEAGKTMTVDVDSMYAHALTPYPAEITQSQKQQVLYNGNVYFYSAYVTKSQTTTVTTTNTAIESYSKSPKPVSQSDRTITYGPYEQREAFAEAELRVHYENNSPFLTVTNLERIIEISHWGNIAVEEHINLRHTGALLKGPFSRYDYQRSQDGLSSIKSFKTVLPASARDVYYRDEIGNISTSNLKEGEEFMELELRPRFPLFGGWKTQYYIGYNVPSYQYLFNKGDNYALKMRFVDHVFDDMVVDQMTLKIILPEGSKNMRFEAPYDVQQGENQLHFTYLDTTGRPVIVIHKSNLVEQHIQDFQLHYTFQKMLLLQEPLLVVGAFYLLFLAVIVYVRLDFSITKDEVKESKMRVASLVEEVQSAHDRRSALYQSYDDAINKYKSTKDPNTFAATRKKVDADYKSLTQQISDLQAKLKNEGSDLAEKVGELQSSDRQYKELLGVAITLAEKLVNGKMNKQQYLENEKINTAKREELDSRMEALRSSLA